MQGSAAAQAGNYADAARLFEAAAAAGEDRAGNLYDAACSYALAGRVDDSFRALQASIDAGFEDKSPADDADFASLHGDARWLPLIARFDASHPQVGALKILMDQRQPLLRRYAAGRRAIAAGAASDRVGSLFNQFYGSQAAFIGEYDEGSRMYGPAPVVDDVVTAGYTRAVDALPVVLARAHGRQAVFVNESHGQPATRAFAHALLAGLRADGFDTLAMETLDTTDVVPRDAAHCSNTSLLDAQLPVRGYALGMSGYYSQDPVYAETIREALRLGFKLVAYDSVVPGRVPEREQNEAENLACVFKADPKARLVVVAGFTHIAEAPKPGMPEGWMARRFRVLTGIDPLTVDTTTQLYLDPSHLAFASDHAAGDALAYALQDANGATYGTEDRDIALYVPMAAHRGAEGPTWLTLGGLRGSNGVSPAACRGRDLCFVQARRVGELPDAVAADACVLSPEATSCTLYLRPGRYDLVALDDAGAELSRQALDAGAPANP